MAELLSVATAVGDHRVTAAETKDDLAAFLPAGAAAPYQRMVDAAGNATRWLVAPLAELRRLETLADRARAYEQHVLRLGEQVARAALAEASVAAEDVAAVIGISSTGHLMPTLDTHLIDRLGLSPGCRRVPLLQLGCAGGVAGLGLASTLSGASSAPVLVVSVELPSLSLPAVEPTPYDVVATTQFGDGAAAAVIAPGQSGRGPVLLDAGSMVFPGTLRNERVHWTPTGLRQVRPRGLQPLLRTQLADAVDGFLARHGRARRDIAFWVLQPRNAELLQAAADGLGLPADAVAPSRAVWRGAGNLVSAAVFHGLRETAQSAPPPAGALGMLVAYGIGVSCEMVLMQAGGWMGESERVCA